MEFSLDYLKLKIVIQLKEDTVLPRFPATTFRGGMGAVFKKSFCLSDSDKCLDCEYLDTCIFSYIFKTSMSKEAEIRNQSQLVAPPYIIQVPFTKNKKEYKKREIIEVELTILGNAIDYLSYFIYAFKELGQKGLGRNRSKFDILYVSHENEIIYENDSLKKKVTGKSFKAKGNNEQSKVEEIELSFDYPVRIEKSGQLVSENFTFELILRNIMRRLDSITYFHMDYKLDLNFSQLVAQAKDIKQKKEQMKFYDNIRYSKNKEKKIWMGGFVGKIKFQGGLNKFIPLLKAGEIINLGKKCAYGMGDYQLKYNK